MARRRDKGRTQGGASASPSTKGEGLLLIAGEDGSGSESSGKSGNSRFGDQANGICSQDAWVAQYSQIKPCDTSHQ